MKLWQQMALIGLRDARIKVLILGLLTLSLAYLGRRTEPAKPLSSPARIAPQNVEIEVIHPTFEPVPPEGTPASEQPSDPPTVGSPLATGLNAKTGTAIEDVEILDSMLQNYLIHLGRRQGLPIGNDSDLAQVLTGHNPMNLVILPTGHPSLASDGHLCDRWGTPYFVHPCGNNWFEIRSAGPDRRLFSPDDIALNPSFEDKDPDFRRPH